jgi:hypothetical protein
VKPEDFGGEKNPLRSSRLARFMQCPWSEAMQHLAMVEDEQAGAAADTGSAMHFAAQLWHTRLKGDARLAVAAMRMALERYPFADLDSAEDQFRRYAADPRNLAAKVVLVEAAVRVEIPPAPGDPTGAPVIVMGTVDQVREEPGGLRALDIKTGGKYEGPDMLDEHCLQLAAYQLGATYLLGREVRAASIIRTKDYLKTDRMKRPKPGPVFWEAPWSLDDCRALMRSVAAAVAEVRRGLFRHAPGGHCRYCPAGGVAQCTKRLP